ncbi:hypothetical protein K523DRAFT_326629, partial [Schizophyllum commune Tattone D]
MYNAFPMEKKFPLEYRQTLFAHPCDLPSFTIRAILPTSSSIADRTNPFTSAMSARRI